MLPVTAASIRIFLHVLGATVWIGGQIVLAALVPVVRPAGPAQVRAVARRFQMLAWPAFGLLVATGIWNLVEVHLGNQSSQWLTTLLVKLVLVGASGAAAALHIVVGARAGAATQPGAQRRLRAVAGGLAGIALLAALGAAFCGVLL